MTIVLWASVAMVFYVYVGYPVLLRLLGAVLGRDGVARGGIEPKASLLISAYNEASVIRAKLLNSLALDYPREQLEITVISDCSTDDTDRIVRDFSRDGVRLNRNAERLGKSSGLNASVPCTSGEILVFSDANALYRPDAIRKLVRNFNDPRVGCVTGESRYVETDRSIVGRQEGAYWSYERLLKTWETWRGSMVGADGAIFAVRRSLYAPLEAADINDFVTPLQVVMKGYRCVYEPEAVCEERGTARYDEEFRRKVRIVNRSLYALRKTKALLDPFRYGWFSFQLVSHKMIRWAMPLWLGAAFVSSLYLSSYGTAFRNLFLVQAAFYVVALAGAGLSRFGAARVSLLTLPYYFCMVNGAAALGALRALTGHVQVTWTPERDHTRPAS